MEQNDGGGYAIVYFLDNRGYKRSIEATGTWQAYSSNVKKPETQVAFVQKIAEAVVQVSGGTATAEEVISKLRKDLDAIAAQADD